MHALARSLIVLLALAAPALAAEKTGIEKALDYTVTLEGEGRYGTGVLVAPAQGLIVTQLHVVEGLKALTAAFLDGTRLPARILDSDRKLDIALLEITPQPSRSAPVWGDSSALRPGDELYAVGCPRHLPFTVSRGIVSFVGRELEGTRYLQTDLPINEGNSGGPMVNARGELMGFVSFILKRSQGLSFALPSNSALDRFRKFFKPLVRE